MSSLPLTSRPLDDLLLVHDGRSVTVSGFLGQATEMADRLPASSPVINLCQDRYAFSVVFAAALIAGGTNLLPANRLPATIDSLRRRYDGAVIVSDQARDHTSTQFIDPTDALDAETCARTVPLIPASQLAAIVFTSGSTGSSSAVEKPWQTFHRSSLINVAELGLADGAHHVVATVPPQHMWGLETTVLAPWFAPLTAHSGQPFFVADIIAALSSLPSPRMLVSTPVHLRALAEQVHDLPTIELILSATAPLSPALASRLETGCGGRVVEVYGCSETGCLARRAAAVDDPWRLFSEFELESDGDSHMIHAAHLPAPVQLMDRLDVVSDRQFRLAGRHGDLINIAGKRASLAQLTQTLLDIPGVIDGVIFQPSEHADGPVGRLAALVVAPGLNAAAVRRQLATRIDAAFMPRPLNLVDHLPRAATGKLPRQAVIDLHQRLELSDS